jgi:hypothetical protein
MIERSSWPAAWLALLLIAVVVIAMALLAGCSDPARFRPEPCGDAPGARDGDFRRTDENDERRREASRAEEGDRLQFIEGGKWFVYRGVGGAGQAVMVKNELDILNKFAVRAPHGHGQLGECAAELLRDLRQLKMARTR